MNYPYLDIDLTCNIMRNGKQRITGSLGYNEYHRLSMKPQCPAQPSSAQVICQTNIFQAAECDSLRSGATQHKLTRR